MEEKIEKLIRRVEKLTDGNAHTQAVKEIARVYSPYRVLILDHLEAIHEILKHMPRELQAYRAALADAMIDEIRKTHGDEIADKIHGAL